ncbi:hypothetical protein [Spirulina major]|uniref:hypothetical protein n=1 Tax=Spirulina major TaxID=270636 RepID=UPI0015871AC1|nr:hypothetical protein [Spirulina major]
MKAVREDQALIHSKSEIQFTKIAEAAEYRKTLAKGSDRQEYFKQPNFLSENNCYDII